MQKKQLALLLLLLTAIFLFLRLWNLDYWITTGADQGSHILAIYDIVVNHHLTLLGPSSSFSVLNGRTFFFGPITYYLPIPAILLFGFSQLTISYFMVFLNLICLLAFLAIGLKEVTNKKIVWLFALIFTFSPTMIHYSQFLWNPNLHIPITLLVLGCLLKLKTIKKPHDFIWIFCLGLLIGLGLQAHFSFVLGLVVIFSWLAKLKKFTILNLVVLLFSFGIGFSPLIFFEMRHNFYNLQTIGFYLAKPSSSGFSPFYLLSLLPFIYLLVATLLTKLKRFHIGNILLCLFIIYSLITVLPKPDRGFMMPQPGWNYLTLVKIRDIILSENKPNYNILDSMTGDNRALYLRSLLTLSGKPPLGVADYPSDRALFFYTKMSLANAIKYGPWEMSASLPGTITKSWDLGDGIHLYLLEKTG